MKPGASPPTPRHHKHSHAYDDNDKYEDKGKKYDKGNDIGGDDHDDEV